FAIRFLGNPNRPGPPRLLSQHRSARGHAAALPLGAAATAPGPGTSSQAADRYGRWATWTSSQARPAQYLLKEKMLNRDDWSISAHHPGPRVQAGSGAG